MVGQAGHPGVKEFVFGWKLHLLVDAEYELPIAANVSAGNVHDVLRASNVLSEAWFTYSKFHPRYVLADAGYSSVALHHLIVGQYTATPIIDLNPKHKARSHQEQRLLSLAEVAGDLQAATGGRARFLTAEGSEVAEPHHRATEA